MPSLSLGVRLLFRLGCIWPGTLLGLRPSQDPPFWSGSTAGGLSKGRLKAGAPLGIGSGSLALMKNAPHPNAARVFINWFLSREGQIAVQEEQARDNSGADSMRIDVPKDVVLSVYRRREGAKYLFVGTPERTNMQPIYKVVKEALATAAKRK